VGANLYLPAAGYRDAYVADLGNVGTHGNYWSSTVSGTRAYYLYIQNDYVFPGLSDNRGYGYSVRCISE
jgi:uncharacterized protein (TIGR02145 family)